MCEQNRSALTPEARYLSAVENYLKNLKYQGRSQKTLKTYSDKLGWFFRFWTERYPEGAPGDPSYSDVEAWRDDMVNRGLTANTVSQRLMVLRYFFQAMSDPELEEARGYTKNPVAKRLAPKVPAKPYEELLTPEQTAALFVNQRAPKARKELWPRNYAMVILLLTTGIRNAELLDLTPADLEWDEAENWGLLTVRHGKGNKYRAVDLPKIAWLAVQLYLKSGIRPADAGEHDPLFGTTAENGPLPQTKKAPWHKGCTNWLSDVVERHVRAVTGVEDIRSNDLRRSYNQFHLYALKSAEKWKEWIGQSESSIPSSDSPLSPSSQDPISPETSFIRRDVPMDLFTELNSEQRQAAATPEGYIRVIAGAGSGKTKALTARYLFLTRELNISPDAILCVTFTNKAAGEMKKRIQSYLKNDECGYICTFHSFCVKLLHEDIHLLSYPKNFSILDKEDAKLALSLCFERLGISLAQNTIKDVMDFISRQKRDPAYVDLMTSPDEAPLIEAFQKAKTQNEKLFFAYLMEQKKSFSLDYDDLILFSLYILQKDEAARLKWQRRLQYIMVDEFQDVNSSQYALVSILSGFHKNLFVVGDPDQTIYTWRGARPELLINFDQDFPTAKTILMEKNYRSNKDILSAANDLIRKNSMRIEKNLVPILPSVGKPIYFYAADQTQEAKWVVTQIASLLSGGVKASDICILYRSHFLSREIEEQLIQSNIAYKIYNGVAFYQRKEIKDVHAYLRFLLTQDDLSFRRIINTPKRKYGKKSMDRLTEYAESKKISLYAALMETGASVLSPSQKNAVQDFVNLVEKYTGLAEEMSIGELMQAVLRESGYEAMLQTQGDQDRLDNLAELKQAVVRYENQAGEDVTLQDYLEHISLFSDEDEADTEAVKIMTVHSAKGLEFPYVFIYELSESVFPSAKSNTKPKMEEERRLAYVAFTRAKEKLFLTSAAGSHPYYGNLRPSRFIFNAERVNLDYVAELPEDVRQKTIEYISNQEKMLEILKDGYLPDNTRIRHSYFGSGTILGHDEELMDYIIQFDNLETERSISIEATLTLI